MNRSEPGRREPVVDPMATRIAMVLTAGGLVAVTLLAVGLILMVVTGVTPDAAVYPSFEPSRLAADLLAFRPEGFLWAGIVVVIATPVVRVVVELVGFAARGDRTLAFVAAAILVVIAVSVMTALATEV